MGNRRQDRASNEACMEATRHASESRLRVESRMICSKSANGRSILIRVNGSDMYRRSRRSDIASTGSQVASDLSSDNASHQRAGARRVDFKADPTAGSVACDCYAHLRADSGRCLRSATVILEMSLDSTLSWNSPSSNSTFDGTVTDSNHRKSANMDLM